MTESDNPKRRRRRRRPRATGEPKPAGEASSTSGAPQRKRRRRGPGESGERSDSSDRAEQSRERRPRSQGASRRGRRGQERDGHIDPPSSVTRDPHQKPLYDTVLPDSAEVATVESLPERDPNLPVELARDLPAESSDPDPSTEGVALAGAPDNASFTNLVGVKFQIAGRITTFNAGDEVYEPGDQVIVDSDLGTQVGTVALASSRRAHPRRKLSRVMRRATASDLDDLNALAQRAATATAEAKALAREIGLAGKVFRFEYGLRGDRGTVYLSADGKLDSRAFVRQLGEHLKCRVSARQMGARDEAKLVGGIGSCGQELCCTTWLPAFVPVSIRHAKDQGIALNPTKLAGQCGRLKCCLVYEHATYAEMRKGMPKLGKQVITADGDGRVVEVDVMRQRVRVSLISGTVKVYGRNDVEPKFPPQKRSD